MALTKEVTSATIKKYGAKETDTGNVKVQIAIMTQRVQQLTEHIQEGTYLHKVCSVPLRWPLRALHSAHAF